MINRQIHKGRPRLERKPDLERLRVLCALIGVCSEQVGVHATHNGAHHALVLSLHGARRLPDEQQELGL